MIFRRSKDFKACSQVQALVRPLFGRLQQLLGEMPAFSGIRRAKEMDE